MDSKLAHCFLFFALLVSLTKAVDPCASKPYGSGDLSIIPTYSKCSPITSPKTDSFNTVLTMASKDPERFKYLSNLVAQKTTSAPIASGQQVLNIPNYIVQIKLGTPGQLMYMVLDTSNDIAWVPCSGCTGCSSITFSPNTSTTFGQLDCSVPQCAQARGLSCLAGSPAGCSFNQSYGGGSSFSASLVQDALGLGKDLGPVGQPKSIRTTPLLKNPRRPSLYYVNLTGISVGKVLVPIAPQFLAFDPTTGAGTIIDSGTTITRFVQPVYDAIRDEFRKQVNTTFSSLGAFDTCFNTNNEAVAPAITFRLTGLVLTLPLENSLIHSSSGTLACLAMAAAPTNVNSVLNVIANLQQQNLRILFDVANSRLGIARELCN
ncbi:hypothetical protein ACLB2K_046730 [Fragaria x ananassa]